MFRTLQIRQRASCVGQHYYDPSYQRGRGKLGPKGGSFRFFKNIFLAANVLMKNGKRLAWVRSQGLAASRCGEAT